MHESVHTRQHIIPTQILCFLDNVFVVFFLTNNCFFWTNFPFIPIGRPHSNKNLNPVIIIFVFVYSNFM